MTLEHTTDMLGQDLRAGDTIAVAFREGNSAAMRVGTVVGFGTKKSSAYWLEEDVVDVMEVQWHKASPYGWLPEGKTSKIELHHKRFVKVTLDTPEEPVV
jgi:hypothetical protein